MPPSAPEAGADQRRLIADAATLGVSLNDAQADTLVRFQALLAHWNRAFNLVSRRDTHRLMARHLLDSLSAAPLLAGERVMDLGTGAGLPGVPLAIALTDVHFTLVDRNARKIRFVTQAARTLELENVTAWCGDVRQLPGEAAFDTIVSRAVSDPRGAWSLAGERLAPAGRMVVLHQGQGDRSADEDPQTPPPPGETVAVTRHEVRIPGLAKSHVLVTMRRQSH